MKYNKVIRALLLLSVVMLATLAKGQESRTSELYRTLKARDSLVFEVGFNRCNLSPYDTLISEDLEFYHDKAGPSYGKAAFIASVQKNICSGEVKPKRELVDSSLKVFPCTAKMYYTALYRKACIFFILRNPIAGNIQQPRHLPMFGYSMKGVGD
ncbi:nuclear transport factor 2 family protein [Niabella sp. W65]|nr:nuclear transport factor 2 family protein [Niabella sp. W65]MCH7361405.1 nuclear transport factor 2 family protein [Niabella sp. W65]ULT45210.1 nuclear transport factor 2 family protein [Niabella sp. I65]